MLSILFKDNSNFVMLVLFSRASTKYFTPSGPIVLSDKSSSVILFILNTGLSIITPSSCTLLNDKLILRIPLFFNSASLINLSAS
jgi:hypothetical protein